MSSDKGSPNKAALLSVRLCPAVRRPNGSGTGRADDPGATGFPSHYHLGDDGAAHPLDRGTVLHPAASCFSSFSISLFCFSVEGFYWFVLIAIERKRAVKALIRIEIFLKSVQKISLGVRLLRRLYG